MKWTALFLSCLGMACAAELSDSRTVYLLPMGRGLEQYIANRLTRMHVLQVVTDPAKADVVITDNVGSALEDRLNDLYPPEKPPAPAKPAPEAKDAAKSPAEPPKATPEAPRAKAESAPAQPASGEPPKDEEEPEPAISSPGSETANRGEGRGYMAAAGHGRGTVFLVDVKSRQVLWSMFERPKSNSAQELDRAAKRIVKSLKEDLAAK